MSAKSALSVYSVPRFLQFRDRQVHCLRTQEQGEFVGVIFTNGNAEIHDLRGQLVSAKQQRKRQVLQLRNVVDLCFMRFERAISAVLVAQESAASPFLGFAVFVEWPDCCGWSEVAVSVEVHRDLQRAMECRYRKSWRALNVAPPEIAIDSVSGFIVRSHGHIVSVCSSQWESVFVWRASLVAGGAAASDCGQCRLSEPIAIPLGQSPIYCQVMTQHALFASDLQCIRISPAPSVRWNGVLKLKVPAVHKLAVLTSHLVLGIDGRHKLFVFGVDREGLHFKGFYLPIECPLPVAHCLSFPIESADDAEKEPAIGMMGWNAKKYLLALKTPDHPQSVVFALDSMFVSAVVRSKETKRALKLSGYPSKIVCAPTNSLQIVGLAPDMILIPNQHDIHCFLFTFS